LCIRNLHQKAQFDQDLGFETEYLADRVETPFTGALASIGLEILSGFFEPGIFGL
jgi:hypothetical protein